LEGTALGALVMPVCSGLGNLLFVVVAQRRGVESDEVAINALGNNLTNLLLILPLVALGGWLTLKATGGATARSGGKTKAGTGGAGRAGAKAETRLRLGLLSLYLTLGAAVAFP